jgi:hypothetical protein
MLFNSEFPERDQINVTTSHNDALVRSELGRADTDPKRPSIWHLAKTNKASLTIGIGHQAAQFRTSTGQPIPNPVRLQHAAEPRGNARRTLGTVAGSTTATHAVRTCSSTLPHSTVSAQRAARVPRHRSSKHVPRHRLCLATLHHVFDLNTSRVVSCQRFMTGHVKATRRAQRDGPFPWPLCRPGSLLGIPSSSPWTSDGTNTKVPGSPLCFGGVTSIGMEIYKSFNISIPGNCCRLGIRPWPWPSRTLAPRLEPVLRVVICVWTGAPTCHASAGRGS